MAMNVTKQMNMAFLSDLIGKSQSKGGLFGKKSTITNIARGLTLNLRDSFKSTAADSVIKMTVQKMQAAINRPLSLNPASAPVLNQNGQTASAPQPAPTQREIDQATALAGGADALRPWLVDGATRFDIGGRKAVVAVGGAEPQTPRDVREAAAASLARFGLDADMLDAEPERVRGLLKEAAAVFSNESPGLASAIEYALEDAYAKVAAYERGVGGGAETFDVDAQTETNLRQAREIAAQLGLGEGDVWGVESLARDLAVFGMDMTAMAGEPGELAQTINDKSLALLADLNKRYVGTEAEYVGRRNQITGASARLVNGLRGAGGSLIRASMSMDASFSSSRVKVSVEGVKIDAGAVIAVGNVIVDPLVLDLNGDGIDLKGADEGVDFDMKGNGETSRMGFIRGDDAFLFVDEYGDGLVRDGRQLFGNADGYANGFEKLRAYDDNGDGVIDENDAIFDKLRVWVERNEDGVCEEGETMSLREAGISSINVGYQDVREDDGKGNLIGQIGSFNRTDGTSGRAADVWLQEKARDAYSG